MFDDQTTNGGATPPPNLPIEPEDMFAGIDEAPSTGSATPKALGAGMLKPKNSNPTIVMPQVESPDILPVENYNTKTPIIGKVIVGITGLVVLVGMGFGGWWLYGRFFALPKVDSISGEINRVDSVVPENSPLPTETTPIVEANVVAVVNEPTSQVTEQVTDTTTTVAQMQSDQLLFGERKDSDNDGVDDSAEQTLGTNLQNSDSDLDKLCDGDEVLIWKTDPLKTDTDGDKYPDGTEIYNGYSPIGTGKIGPLPPGFTTSTVCQSSKK